MQFITLTIHNLGSSGEGIGSLDGFTVFVPGALPGEEVEARLVLRKKNYAIAELIRIIKPAPERRDPVCPLFGRCGGCQLMHMSYEKQLEVKRQKVMDALERIGKFKGIEVKACRASPNPLAYRNKIQLPVREEGSELLLGLYARDSHDLVPVEHCFIHCELGERVYAQVRRILQEERVRGLRHVLIKSALATNQALVVFVTAGKAENLAKAAEKIQAACPEVQGVIHNLHTGPENVILGRDYKVLCGQGFMYEELNGLRFKISPASFFQVNPAQAEQLYQQALGYAGLMGTETVLDAYCGVGTLSLFMAKRAKHVIGVECVPAAIHDAKENAALNGITNVTFVCAASEKYIAQLKDIQVALVNPPRKGCDPQFLAGLLHLAPERIVYVSCDPATLARDLAILAAQGYDLKAVQPFDMFPQTAHVETVVLFSKK